MWDCSIGATWYGGVLIPSCNDSRADPHRRIVPRGTWAIGSGSFVAGIVMILALPEPHRPIDACLQNHIFFVLSTDFL